MYISCQLLAVSRRKSDISKHVLHFFFTGDFRFLTTNYSLYTFVSFYITLHRVVRPVMFFYMLYYNFMGVTISFLSSDLVKSWGECDGHTWGLARRGWTGGGGGTA